MMRTLVLVRGDPPMASSAWSAAAGEAEEAIADADNPQTFEALRNGALDGSRDLRERRTFAIDLCLRDSTGPPPGSRT